MTLTFIIIFIGIYYFFVPIDPFDGLPPDDHNVHQNIVRNVIWNKFFILQDKAKNIKNLESKSLDECYRWIASLPDDQRKIKLLLLHQIICKNENIIATDGELYGEKFIFGLVWWRFKDKNYDLKILAANMIDCISDEMLPWCITGRVSRYINSLTSVDEDAKLAEPELTENIIFNEALNELSVIYKQIMDKDKKYKEAVISGSTTNLTNEKEKKYKQVIFDYLKKKYNLDNSKINELLEVF